MQDPDGDGVYTFKTQAVPAGKHEAKVALDESWDVNYGKDGVPGGANIQFRVPTNGAKTKFSYDAASHLPTRPPPAPPPPPRRRPPTERGRGARARGHRPAPPHTAGPLLYRTPGGAVP